jgi:SagB-type dehydrogenase family enzyme
MMKSVQTGREFLKADDWSEWAQGDHETDERKGLKRPPAQKPYPEGSKLIDLVAAEDLTVGDAPLKGLIAGRRSRRMYTVDPLSIEELSFLLWATQGVTEISRRDGTVATRRTVPGGGSLHTFETYLFINRVTGIESGLYRYLPIEHKLLFLKAGPELGADIVAGCSGQDFVGQAAVVFVWTTIPYRMEWRYTIVGSKVIALEAGHMCQDLYLASEAIGAGTCAIGAYDQKKMDEVLGVDGTDEFTIYAAPVGKIG